jgi:hypothetical protein
MPALTILLLLLIDLAEGIFLFGYQQREGQPGCARIVTAVCIEMLLVRLLKIGRSGIFRETRMS